MAKLEPESRGSRALDQHPARERASELGIARWRWGRTGGEVNGGGEEACVGGFEVLGGSAAGFRGSAAATFSLALAVRGGVGVFRAVFFFYGIFFSVSALVFVGFRTKGLPEVCIWRVGVSLFLLSLAAPRVNRRDRWWLPGCLFVGSLFFTTWAVN